MLVSRYSDQVTPSRNRSRGGSTQALCARRVVDRDDSCADRCAVAVAVYNNVLKKRANLQAIPVDESLNICITLDNKLIFISCHTK